MSTAWGRTLEMMQKINNKNKVKKVSKNKSVNIF